MNISWREILSGNFQTDWAQKVVWQIRFPRLLTASLIGASLALSGLIYQTTLRNPLAEPYLLGVSSGAALGAALAIYWGMIWIPVWAFGMAMATLFCVFGLARIAGRFSILSLILSGVIVSSLMNAFILLLVKLSGHQSQSILFWLMGNLSYHNSTDLLLFGMGLLIVFLILWKFSSQLNLFVLDEEDILLLGVPLNGVRFFLLGLVSLLTAWSVSLVGIIGFVGLMVPHLARLWVGERHAVLLPITLLCGAVLLVWADWFCHQPLWLEELPIGLVTAILGAPFFLFLMLHQKSKGKI